MRFSTSGSGEAILVESYRFRPEDLKPATRLPGISAFMRIRNGADFLERTIRSHIAHVDEIVAVYNQCTDATPEILGRLAREFGPERLRVFHYGPAVFPPGSAGHAAEPADSPRSLVNYYNFALAMTRRRIATKLDDDHLAMEAALAAMTRDVQTTAPDTMTCFSGLNLARDEDGRAGILAREPFSGSGDIGFFPVSAETYYEHDARFERMRRGGLRRRFAGFVYWHLKFLKPGFGFANYDIDTAGNHRYAAKRERHLADQKTIGLEALRHQAPALLPLLARLPLPEKQRLRRDRWRALGAVAPAEFERALRELGLGPAATP